MDFFTVLALISAVAFLIYGALCLSSPYIKSEFKRYGLEKFRVTVGVLELVGAVGQVIGLYWPLVFLLASLGLFLMMVLAMILRIRLGDSFFQMMPALILMVINFYLLAVSYEHLASLQKYISFQSNFF